MQLRVLVTSLLLAPLTGAQDSSSERPGGSGLTVRTSSGTYTGLINSTAPDVNQWLGIPYARPPLGTRRFMPPEKAPNAPGNNNAKAYKPICYQDSGDKTGIYWELVPEFQNRDPQSEDCLYLNIWAPRRPVERKVPVIVWVVGGGFKEGGGHALYQVPDKWIQRTQSHIVVTFKYAATFREGDGEAKGLVLTRRRASYRLNIFGFPGSPAAGKNVGLMDVRLVYGFPPDVEKRAADLVDSVEWLKDNIGEFG